MAILNFDARTVQPDTGTEVLPDAWYEAAIDESAISPTSDGLGAFLKLRFNVLSGQYAGKKVIARLNIRNANPTAQEIAYKQLSAIAHAVNILMVEDSQQLHGIPLKIKLKIRKGGPKLDKDTGNPTGEMYEDQNDITTYKNINEPTPAPGGATAVTQHFAAQPPQHMAAPAMPWSPAAPTAQAPMPPQAAPPSTQPWAQQPPAAPPAWPAAQPPAQAQAPAPQGWPAQSQQQAPAPAMAPQPPAPPAAPWAQQQAPQQQFAPPAAAPAAPPAFAPPQAFAPPAAPVAAPPAAAPATQAPPWAQAQPQGGAPAWTQPPQA